MNTRVLVSLLALSALLLLPFVLATELFDPAEQLEKETGIDINNIPTDPETIKKNYLKQEWSSFLNENKYLGPPTRVIDAILTFLDPFFKIILGVPYSLSWLFIFALLCWFALFYFAHPPMSEFIESKPLSILSAAIVASIVGTTGVIRRAADMLNTVITERWLLYLSLFLTLIIGVILHLLGKHIKTMIKQNKEAAAKEQEKHDRTVLHVDAKVAEKELDSYKEK